MSINRQTFQIRFDTGGFTSAPNLDSIPPSFLVGRSSNINLNEGGRRTRGGTAKLNSGVALSGAVTLNSIYDFTMTTGTQFVMKATSDGNLYKDFATSLYSSVANAPVSFETFDDTLFFCDGTQNIRTWDGAAGTTTAIASPSGTWATESAYPEQLEIHGRGLSRRLWTWTSTNRIFGSDLMSSATTAADFGGSGAVEFIVPTAWGESITAIKDFGDTLFIFTNRKCYLLNDTDIDDANWGIETAQFDGGCAHWRLLVETETDLISMMEDGNIYSVVGANQKGDYTVASINTGAYIHKWIRDNTDLTKITQFHALYDPNIRGIKFFMVGTGLSVVNLALVYSIDRQPIEAWSPPHKNDSFASGYDAACSAVVRTGAGVYEFQTGDYAGWVWKLEQTARNDDGEAYTKGIEMPPITFGDERIHKFVDSMILVGSPTTVDDFTVNYKMDGIPQTNVNASMTTQGGAVFGQILFGGSTFGASTEFSLSEAYVPLGTTCRRCQIYIFDSTVNDDFFLSELLIDFKPVGRKPSNSS